MDFTKEELIAAIKVMSAIDSNFNSWDIVDWFCSEVEITCDIYDEAIKLACSNISNKIGLDVIKDGCTVKYKTSSSNETFTLDSELYEVNDSVEKLIEIIIYNDAYILDNASVGIEMITQLFRLLG